MLDIEVDMVEVGMGVGLMDEADMGVEDMEEVDIEVVDTEAVDKVDGAVMEVEDETRGGGVVRRVIISVDSISILLKAKHSIEMKMHMIKSVKLVLCIHPRFSVFIIILKMDILYHPDSMH